MTGAPRIVFVADAGPAVGGGHVMRCLTLAQALARTGAQCAFVATAQAKVVLDAFAGPEFARLGVAGGAVSDLAGQGAAAARDWRADAAVIDHYGFAPGSEAVVAAAVGRTMAIDDLARPHACDLVLDSNLGRTAADYPSVEALTGPAYALVRPAFAALRETALQRRRNAPAVRRILLSLGLTDVGGITAKVVEALRGARGEAAFDVVVGAAAPSLTALRAMARPGVAVHVDTRDMAALTAAADLAVGAGGSSTWERCCLGLPTVLLVLAENQRRNAQLLAEAGAAVQVDATDAELDVRLVEAVDRLAATPDVRVSLTEASARLCDGRGADRVTERLLRLVSAA